MPGFHAIIATAQKLLSIIYDTLKNVGYLKISPLLKLNKINVLLDSHYRRISMRIMNSKAIVGAGAIILLFTGTSFATKWDDYKAACRSSGGSPGVHEDGSFGCHMGSMAKLPKDFKVEEVFKKKPIRKVLKVPVEKSPVLKK
ncbi:hypothetical protein [Cohaesibacter celericrescens]|uniref:hypothetical protein n=1 Tax=Cohaesibacter celericrescens TaxID=2067669 RepID=UPI003562C6B7